LALARTAVGAQHSGAVSTDPAKTSTVTSKGIRLFSFALVVLAAGLLFYGNPPNRAPIALLNVSYDPTRELYSELDAAFAIRFRRENGLAVDIRQSHGGSARQARAVEDGLAADVVTLGMPSDIDALRKFELVAADWRRQFPDNAEPYFSTIVFVVRKGNPHQIKNWADLAAPGLEVVTPNPKTSANGKLSFLAAWGSVIYQGGTEAQARELVAKMYANVTTLGSGARDSANTFELAGTGDVQLTWENEAIRETRESKGELQIIYPATSIRAEPSVAIVTPNAVKHHVEPAAQALLAYLFEDEAQEILARDGYRPSNPAILAKHGALLPHIALFPITLIATDWLDAQAKFFDDGGVFDAIRPRQVPMD
jgi:sulfate/thiosulfate-binding protein